MLDIFNKKNNKSGISLITLVTAIIILMILSSIIIATLIRNDNFISRTDIAIRETAGDSIRQYVLTTYTHVTSDLELTNNPLDELVLRITTENINRKHDDRFSVILLDKTNRKIIVGHRRVEEEIIIPIDESKISTSSEDIQVKKYSVIFNYKDINNMDQKRVMYISSGQTIQGYLNSTGDTIPKSTEWSPSLILDNPVIENRLYREK